MSWSYSGDPQVSDLDEVRFLIQDVEKSEPLFADEEIQYAISKLVLVYDDNLMVAAYLCDVLASSYAGEGSISADGVTVSTEGLQQKYKDMSARFRRMHREISGMGGGPVDLSSQCFPWPDFGTRPKVFGLGSLDNNRAGRQNTPARWPVADAPTTEGWWGP